MEDISLLLSGSEFARLKASAARGRGVHAYLITGQPGTGKRTFAHLIAAALLCASEAPPCLECGICRRVTEDKHPDVHIFSSSKKSIAADDIRTLCEHAQETSYDGGRRVFIINDAHKMTQAAQNCLLKTLEEPEGSAVFILISAYPEQLLSTVRSRCRIIRIGERSREAVAAQLVRRGTDAQTADRAAAACGGCIGAALAAACGEAPGAEKAHSLLTAADSGSFYKVWFVLNQSKDNAEEMLRASESLLALKLEEDPSDVRTLMRIRAINQALTRLKGNINYGLICDKLAREFIIGETVWQR